MPIVRCREIFARNFRSGIFLIIALGAWGANVDAQTIRIKLVNGRNGHSMAATCVNVWVGNDQKSAMAIPTDADGVALLRLTDKEAEVNLQRRWKQCGEFGVANPVARYESSIRINAGYVLCKFSDPDHTWLAIQSFSVSEVLQHGVVTENKCGDVKILSVPGQIVVFVRPLSWWEKLKE